MGFNPAWRNSLAFVVIGTTWRDGADLTEIEATRQILVQDMRILEGIAPESGAYFNEVRVPRLFTSHRTQFFSVSTRCRAPVGIEIRIRLEEIVLRDSLRQAPSHQAEVRSRFDFPRSRRYRIRRVGRRSRLPSLKQLQTTEPTGAALVRTWGVGCVLRVSPFTIHVLYQGLE